MRHQARLRRRVEVSLRCPAPRIELAADELEVVAHLLESLLTDKVGDPGVQIRDQTLGHSEHLAAAIGGEHQLGPSVVRVGDTNDVSPLLEVRDQLGHGLLGHVGTVGQRADGRAGVVEVLENVAVRRTEVHEPVFDQTLGHEVIEDRVGLTQLHHDVATRPICGPFSLVS